MSNHDTEKTTTLTWQCRNGCPYVRRIDEAFCDACWNALPSTMRGKRPDHNCHECFLAYSGQDGILAAERWLVEEDTRIRALVLEMKKSAESGAPLSFLSVCGEHAGLGFQVVKDVQGHERPFLVAVLGDGALVTGFGTYGPLGMLQVLPTASPRPDLLGRGDSKELRENIDSRSGGMMLLFRDAAAVDGLVHSLGKVREQLARREEAAKPAPEDVLVEAARAMNVVARDCIQERDAARAEVERLTQRVAQLEAELASSPMLSKEDSRVLLESLANVASPEEIARRRAEARERLAQYGRKGDAP